MQISGFSWSKETRQVKTGDAAGDSAPGPPPATVLDVIVVGHYSACVLLLGGTVKCWGRNSEGALGDASASMIGYDPNQMGAALRPVDLGVGRKATAIHGSANGSRVCANLDDGTVRCWGAGYLNNPSVGQYPNQMGNALVPLNFGGSQLPTSLSLGSFAACAVLSGQVKCWGENRDFLLGQGSGPSVDLSPGLPFTDLGAAVSVRAVYAGENSACALLTGGHLKCWGRSNALGYEGVTTVGATLEQMGDNLPPVNVGVGRTVKDLTLVGLHACAILDNERVKCWGWNVAAQLGFRTDDINYGPYPGNMGDGLPYVDLGTNVRAKSIASDRYSTCVIATDGRVKCWGSPPLATPTNRWAPEMGDLLPYVDLGTGRTVKKLAMGGGIACALLDNNRVKCWGAGSRDLASTGYGDTKGRGPIAPFTMGDFLPYVDFGPQ